MQKRNAKSVAFIVGLPYIRIIAMTRCFERANEMQMKSSADVNVYRVTSIRENFHRSYRVQADNAAQARQRLMRDMNMFERCAFFDAAAYIETKLI